MSEINWASSTDQEQSAQAIAAVRKDGDATDWMYMTYAGTTGAASQQLKFGGSGSGGIDDLKTHFQDNQIYFALVSMTDKIDDSVTVKFIWINFLGTKVGTMMKARLSVALGGVKAFMGQSHLTHTCNTVEEISASIVREKMMATSGSGSSVIDDKTGQAGLKNQNTSVGNVAARQTKKTDDGPLFDDTCLSALADVRNDSTATTWCALVYADSNSQNLSVLGTGTGDVSELVKHLYDDKVVYFLVRKLEQIDNTSAVKFCYIRWLGEDIPRMQKAKLGATSSAIQQVFLPYHVSLDSPDKHEVTDANIMKLINAASGTAVHILEERPKPTQTHQHHQQPKAEPTIQKTVSVNKPVSLSSATTENVGKSQPTRGMGGEKHVTTSTKTEGVINFADEQAIQDAIKSVRNDGHPNDWCLVTYTAPKSSTLKLHGAGQGGLDELRSHLKDDVVMYGLVRTTDRIDDTVAVKFCFVDWRGEQINRMQRANLGVHSGEVTSLFRPYHADVQCHDLSEVTLDIIKGKIQFASGTANYVK